MIIPGYSDSMGRKRPQKQAKNAKDDKESIEQLSKETEKLQVSDDNEEVEDISPTLTESVDHDEVECETEVQASAVPVESLKSGACFRLCERMCA